MTQAPSVLIIQTAFIGDVILATALVESIRKTHPEAVIDFVVRNGNEELVSGNPGIRKVFILDKRRKYASLMELIAAFRKARYDYAINVQRFATTGLMTFLSGAKATIGFDKNPLSGFFTHKVRHDVGGLHEVTRNLRLLSPAGMDVEAMPRIYPSAQQWEVVKGFKAEPYITVSPASVWFTKQWPAKQWSEFLHQISGLKIYILGGPGDQKLGDELTSSIPGKSIVNLAGKLSLVESAALMADARMNFVNDSAPLHLASAMNAPVTAVFCSTVPSFGFGPLSDKSFVIETKEDLDCRPCGLHGFRQCPKGHFRCATSIDVRQLTATLS
ncbi:MAG: glycosyltransferase family 9 protein [Cyclobacteriaceae bacterium]|nr:glycosyltransferase family 9 protein [Cyclobacteriaceae bacterium]